MSAESKRPVLGEAGSEPAGAARGTTVPIWLIVLMFVLLYWGAVYFDQHGAWFNPRVYRPYQSFAELESFQPKSEGMDLARGRMLFETICALCHGVDGAGKPGQAPPLAGSEWAQGNPERMLRIPLYGLAGPVSVKGQDWNLSMPAMGAALSPEDLAAVVSYIRSSWGNKASAVTAEQVSAIKAKVGAHAQPFSVGELNAIP
jgi:mono/diheme cytochrome c family protein